MARKLIVVVKPITKPSNQLTTKPQLMYKVLFISFVNWDSLMEIPALLSGGGCTVDLFCTPKSWVLENKFYNKSIIADENPASFTDSLMEYIAENGNDYQWIIPGDDIIIRMLNDRITSEELFYKVMPITKIENRELLGSKAGFSNLCTKHNIKTPKYLIYNDSLTPADISAHMGYPLMVKMDKSEGGFGIYVCHNEEEMVESLAKVTDKRNLVFQHYIIGHEVNTDLLCKDGELIVYNYSKRLKTIGQFGVSTQRSYIHNNDLDGILQHISRSLGLNGFGNVVFMYDEKECEYYLIEVDARPNSWMYYGKFTGNNFEQAIAKIIKGDLTLLKNDKRPVGKETFVALYKKDVYRCMLEKDYTELLKWAVNWNFRWRYVPLYDKKTFTSTSRFLFNTFTSFVSKKFQRGTGFNLDMFRPGQFVMSFRYKLMYEKMLPYVFLLVINYITNRLDDISKL